MNVVTFKGEFVYDGVIIITVITMKVYSHLILFFLFLEKLDLSMQCNVCRVDCKSRTSTLTDRSFFETQHLRSKIQNTWKGGCESRQLMLSFCCLLMSSVLFDFNSNILYFVNFSFSH